MVVIEVEETNNVNPPKSKAKSRSASTSASANRDASDGFETASDAELPSDGDDEDYNNDGGGARNIGEQQQPQGELEDQTVAPQAQSEGTLNDDDRKQVSSCFAARFLCLRSLYFVYILKCSIRIVHPGISPDFVL